MVWNKVHRVIVPFQSSRSLRTATPEQLRRYQAIQISILAVLADCDLCAAGRLAAAQISILAVLADCDHVALHPQKGPGISILAVLADCDSYCERISPVTCISILAVLADCDFPVLPNKPVGNKISILAVLADCDPGDGDKPLSKFTFQSSRSLRTATVDGWGLCGVFLISILAVLADCDPAWTSTSTWSSNFNPRGPCGLRQQRRTKDLPRLCTKRRIFSPHQKVFCGKDGKTNVFPPLPRAFSGANLPGSVRALGPRTRSSGSLPAGRSACSQSARSCSRISFPGSKNADYPAPDP